MINCKVCQSETKLLLENLSDTRYGYPGFFNVYQCPKCQFGQLEPQLTEQQINNLYTDYYPRKNISSDSVIKSVHNKLNIYSRAKLWLLGNNCLCHFYITANTKVLDVGCGDGRSLLEITLMGADAYGTEKDLNVKSVADKLNLKIHFGDIDTLNYPDNFFDYITMNQLIEHIPDPIIFLKKISKKLKIGGQIIMSTPNINSYNYIKFNKKWINWHVPFHLNFFSQKSIFNLANQTGLYIKKNSTITPFNWVIMQFLSNWQNPADKHNYWQSRPANFSLIQYLHFLGIKKVIILILSRLFAIFTLFFYRGIDQLKKGDSFIIFLQKTK